MTGNEFQTSQSLVGGEPSMGRQCSPMGGHLLFSYQALTGHLTLHQHVEMPEDTQGPCFHGAKPSQGRDNLEKKEFKMSSDQAWDAPTWLILVMGTSLQFSYFCLFSYFAILHISYEVHIWCGSFRTLDLLCFSAANT